MHIYLTKENLISVGKYSMLVHDTLSVEQGIGQIIGHVTADVYLEMCHYTVYTESSRIISQHNWLQPAGAH